jgi:hypothetical protein
MFGFADVGEIGLRELAMHNTSVKDGSLQSRLERRACCLGKVDLPESSPQSQNRMTKNAK